MASRRLLAALALAATLAPLGSTMIAVALPAIGAEVGATPGALTLALVTSYLLGGIVFQSPGGKLGDRFGHTRALAAGQILVAGGALLGTFAPGLPWLILARVLTASGGALIIPAAMAIVRNALPEKERGRAYGLFGALMGFAAAIGPILGGELVSRFGWRAVFTIVLVPVGISALLAWGVAPSTPATRRPRFDFAGSLLLGAGLAAIVLAARFGPVLLVAGAAALVLFVLWERRASDPIIALGIFRVRAFSAGSVAIGLQNLAMYSVIFQIPHFFSETRGVRASVTGRTLLGMTLAMVAMSPLGARLAERIGTRLTVILGAACALAGLALLFDLASLSGPAAALPGLALLGAGIGASTAPLQAAAMNAVAREDSGMAAGITATVRYLGGIGGIATLGFFLDRQWPVITRHRSALVVYAAALAVSAVCAIWLPGRRPPS